MPISLRQRLFVIALSAVLLLPLLFWVFGFRPTNVENTVTAEWPTVSKAGLLSGEYFGQLGEYIADNNMLRPTGIRLNSLIEKNLFGQSSVKRVALGESDWLFYAPASQVSCDDAEELDLHVQQLRKVRDMLSQANKPFIFAMPPNKRSLYTEYERDQSPDGANCANKFREAARLNFRSLGEQHFVDLQVLLEEQLAVHPDIALYTALDTHWSSYASGQFVAALIKRLAPSVLENDELTEVPAVSDIGDLSQMLGDPQTQMLRQFQFSADAHLTTRRFAVPGISSIRAPRLFRTYGSDINLIDQRVLVLHDSFGETLCNQLPRVFASVMFVHWQAFSAPAVAELIRSADAVVVEMVERDTLGWLSGAIANPANVDKLSTSLSSSVPVSMEHWRVDGDLALADGEIVNGAYGCQL